MEAGELVELREFHSTNRIIRGVNTTVKEEEVVAVYDENQPRMTLEVW